MTKLFRVRVKDGYVSPATAMTNVHGTDMENMVVPGPVGLAIMRGKIDWRDVVRCVASGKDPSILISNPDAAKPRAELENAPEFSQVLTPAPEVQTAPVIGELALARAEGRAPEIDKLTADELNEQAKLLGIEPGSYSTQAGLVRAIRKKMEA